MLTAPKMNLRFFDDEVEEEGFDMDKFREEFEKEYEEETPPTEGEGGEETETETQTEEETESPEQEEETSSESGGQETKDGKAFAQMRNQLKEKEQYEGFVKQIADHYGVKPDELMNRFKEQQIQQEAKEQGTNPEVLKRLKDVEAENQQIRQQSASDKFNQQVQQTLKEYDIKDNDPTVQKTMEFIAQNHMNEQKMPTISFGDAYFLANKDDIIQKQVEAAQQKQLEDKKKRQESSALPSGDGKAPESDDWSLEAVEKDLKRRGLLD